ncbi:MAG: hypothetical protein ABIA78_01790 [archaeon]
MVINKKAWIKIVEAFVAILLITGVLLIFINKGYIGENISSKVYDAQILILRGIQVNDNLRQDILISNKSGYDPDISESPLPIEWDDFEDAEQRQLQNLKDKIIEQTPNYLQCIAKICEPNDSCLLNDLDKPSNKEIYAQPVTITANYEMFNPRQLKLFCWVK